MPYLFQKQAILNMIDPYEKNILNLTPAITRQEIHDHLENGDVYEEQGLTNRENMIRKISYLVLNPQFQLVNFNDNFISGEIDNKAEFLAMMLEPLGHAIIENASENVLAQFSHQEVQESLKQYKTEFFSWNNFSNYVEETWDNPEYVLQQIEKSAEQYSATEILKGLSINWRDEMIDNEVFQKGLEALIKKDKNVLKFFTYGSVPASVLFHPKVLDWMAQEDLNAFKTLSLNLYKKIFNLYESLNKKDRYYAEYSLEKYLDVYNKDKVAFKERIKNLTEAYNNRFFLSEQSEIYIQMLLKNIDLLKGMFEHLPKEVTEKPEIVKSYLLGLNDQAFYALPNNLSYELITNNNDLMEIFLNVIVPRYSNIKSNKAFIDSWINDKDKVLAFGKLSKIIYPKYSSDPTYNPFYTFFDVIPTSFRKDIEVMEMFIGMNVRVYNNLSQSMRDNPKLLEAYLNGLDSGSEDDYKASKISLKAFSQIPFYLQLKIIEKAPDLLKIEGFPQDLLDNPKVIIAMTKKEGEMIATKEIFDKIINTPELMKDFILTNKHNFLNLPDYLKKDVRLAKVWLSHGKSINSENLKSNLFPKMLWGSQDFVIALLKSVSISGKDVIKERFWNDRNFMLELLRAIDKGEIHESILNSGPEKMRAIQEYHKVKQGEFEKIFMPCLLKTYLEQDLKVNTTAVKRKKI